jgi:hypothetical protein
MKTASVLVSVALMAPGLVHAIPVRAIPDLASITFY